MPRAGLEGPGESSAREGRPLRALAHPTRVALVEELARRGELTATEAAKLLDTTPANCSFHLRQLAKYGLVVAVESASRREHPWRLGLDRDSDSGGDKRLAMGKILGQVAAVMERSASLEAVELKVGAGFLSEEELASASALLDSLLAAAARRASGEEELPPGAERMSLIFLHYPVSAVPPA